MHAHSSAGERARADRVDDGVGSRLAATRGGWRWLPLAAALLVAGPSPGMAQDCEAACQADHQLCLDDPKTRPVVCIAQRDACLERCGVCRGVADGRPCPGVADRPGDCVAPVCREGRCHPGEPVPDARRCQDLDGSECSEARCVPGAGECDQTARPRPDGAACSDLPDFCGPGTCRDGRCIAGGGAGGPDPADPAAVEVSARPPQIDRDHAFIDCCAVCAHQILEALRPTSNGPARIAPGDDLPRRQKFCGEARRYKVNDEWSDPRDMLFDLAPVDGFEHFVAGMLQTNCTKLNRSQRREFQTVQGTPPFLRFQDCPTDACLRAAADREDKCIHAEVTPPEQFYGEDSRYLPISDEASCDGDGGDSCSSRLALDGATVCVYGVYAYDHGNHRVTSHEHSLCCVRERAHDHPEIHPFDAVWWRHDEHDGWMFAVFQDDSNRYSSPHCGSQNNDSRWSQAPRDVTFEFPFRFPRSDGPKIARLRHVETVGLDGRRHSVVPLNVTTAAMPDPVIEAHTLAADGVTWLEVVEPRGFEQETQVRVSGCVTPTEVMGRITVRAAVGCNPEGDCSDLVSLNPNGRHDPGDVGSGFLYDELIVERTGRPRLTVRLRVVPSDDPGRFTLRVDGVARLIDSGDGGSTGLLELAAGPHRVTQVAAAGTRLGDYRTVVGGDCAADGRVVLARGQEKSCVGTNLRLGGAGCLALCDEERDRCMARGDDPEICLGLHAACVGLCEQ